MCLQTFMEQTGSWIKRIKQQEAYEDSIEMDEGAAEAQAHMQPCRFPKAVFIYYMVHKSKHQPG